MVMERFGAPQPDPATGQAVPTINSSEVFLVMKGGKEGNQTEFMKPFVGAKKYVKNIALYREEESAMNRLGKVQGYATLNCLETLLFVQADKSRVKKATYQHFPTCSTLSNTLGPIVMPPFHQVWRLPWRIKKELYGRALIMVGGQVQDADDIEEPEERKVKRTPEAVEPVFYHGYPPIVFQDILKSLQVRDCIDLTPRDGAAALACYKLGIVYLGFTFTAVHTEQLSTRLEHEIFHGDFFGGSLNPKNSLFFFFFFLACHLVCSKPTPQHWVCNRGTHVAAQLVFFCFLGQIGRGSHLSIPHCFRNIKNQAMQRAMSSGQFQSRAQRLNSRSLAILL